MRGLLGLVTVSFSAGLSAQAAAIEPSGWPRAVSEDRSDRSMMVGDPLQFRRALEDLVQGDLQVIERAYQLSAGQRGRVHAKLDELKDQQMEYSLSVEEEMLRLQADLHPWGLMVQSRPPGTYHLAEQEQRRFSRASKRLTEIHRKDPLLNPRNMIEEIEELLPAEQVRQGHAAWEANSGQRWSICDAKAARDQMEKHVDRFCSLFDLDAGQRARAEAILRDIITRRDRLRSQNTEAVRRASELTDPEDRRQRLQQPYQPEHDLWKELDLRLDRLPTARQVEAVRAAALRPETQPATRPSELLLQRMRAVALRWAATTSSAPAQ